MKITAFRPYNCSRFFFTNKDNIAFDLAKDGFMGNSNFRQTELLEKTEYKIPQHRHRERTPLTHMLAMMTVFSVGSSAFEFMNGCIRELTRSYSIPKAFDGCMGLLLFLAGSRLLPTTNFVRSA